MLLKLNEAQLCYLSSYLRLIKLNEAHLRPIKTHLSLIRLNEDFTNYACLSLMSLS